MLEGVFSALLRFGLYAFYIESNLNLVADDEPAVIQGLIPNHTQVFAVEFPLCAEAGSGIAPGVLRRPVIATCENDLLRHPVQGQISHSREALWGLLVAVQLVGDRRIEFHV